MNKTKVTLNNRPGNLMRMFTHIKNKHLPYHLIDKEIMKPLEDYTSKVPKKIKIGKTGSFSKELFFIDESLIDNADLKVKDRTAALSKRLIPENAIAHLRHVESEEAIQRINILDMDMEKKKFMEVSNEDIKPEEGSDIHVGNEHLGTF